MAAFAEMGQPSPIQSLILQQTSLMKREDQGELEHTLLHGLGGPVLCHFAALFWQVLSSPQIQGVTP